MLASIGVINNIKRSAMIDTNNKTFRATFSIGTNVSAECVTVWFHSREKQYGLANSIKKYELSKYKTALVTCSAGSSTRLGLGIDISTASNNTFYVVGGGVKRKIHVDITNIDDGHLYIMSHSKSGVGVVYNIELIP